jgi:hypothetical protein
MGAATGRPGVAGCASATPECAWRFGSGGNGGCAERGESNSFASSHSINSSHRRACSCCPRTASSRFACLLSCFSSFSFFFLLVTIKTLVPTFFFPGLLCLLRIELGLRALPAEKLWAMKLGLKLLAERAKKHSFWWPYIHKLPERFRMPVFFSGDEIQQLQYPPIIHQVKKRCEFLLQFAAEDIPNIIRDRGNDKHPFGGQQVDASALGWAMAAVSSRAFCVKQSGESGCPSLLPLVDMCNHSFTPTARLVQHHTSSAQLLPFLEVILLISWICSSSNNSSFVALQAECMNFISLPLL